MTEHKEEENIEKKSKKLNLWILSTIVLGVLLIAMLISGNKAPTGNAITEQEASVKVLSTINNYFIQEGSATLSGGVSEESGLYKVGINYNNDEIFIYLTKDGKSIILPNGIVEISQLEQLQQDAPDQNQNTAPEPTVQKSDKPVVELFVMTHCPYGTQAEKGIIPAYEAIGDKAETKIRFVHYFMHGDEEAQETYNQVCIREEQGDKYLSYLKCFLKAGDTEACIKETNIDETKLDKCLTEKAEDYYAVDAVKSEQYGVRGSPTLVINGVTVQSSRSPAAYLGAICSAFNEEPEACSNSLSTSTPGAGFGYTESSGSSTGTC